MKMWQYWRSCTDWPRRDLEILKEIVENEVKISRGNFITALKDKVGKEDLKMLEENLGYESHHSRGLTMSQDSHVGYYRSKVADETFLFFRHSQIEFVFRKLEKPTHYFRDGGL